METTSRVNVTARKSERLTEEEYASLVVFRKRFSKEIDCAATIGIDRNVLARVLLARSGSPATIEKIRIAIGNKGLNG